MERKGICNAYCVVSFLDALGIEWLKVPYSGTVLRLLRRNGPCALPKGASSVDQRFRRYVRLGTLRALGVC